MSKLISVKKTGSLPFMSALTLKTTTGMKRAIVLCITSIMAKLILTTLSSTRSWLASKLQPRIAALSHTISQLARLLVFLEPSLQ